MERVSFDNDLPHKTRQELLDMIPNWHRSVQELLPGVSDDLRVQFDNRWLIHFTGTGGYASSLDQIELAFDADFEGDKTKQLDDLRGSYFHECYHVVQGFVGDEFADRSLSALDNAIYEGAATKFEMLRAGTEPLWGQYPDEDSVKNWIAKLKQLPLDYDWKKWKFYDPETDTRWIMYRAGTFIVDKALEQNTSIMIEDFATKAPSEILQLAKLEL